MDNIKGAFLKVKEEINELREELSRFDELIVEMGNAFYNLDKRMRIIEEKEIPTQRESFQTQEPNIQTNRHIFKPLNDQKEGISNGNEGVQTDKQTNRQTDILSQKGGFSYRESPKNLPETLFQDAINTLDSLDSLKKEIRLKFKRLTKQEITVFSAIYQLDEERGHSDYKTLSGLLGLSESSLRDYVRRLIIKGIPVEKNKINNKEIQLNISSSLKKVASLNTILTLVSL